MPPAISAKQLAAALKQRRGALASLAPSDFVRGFIEDTEFLCSLALPRSDEPLVRQGGLSTPDAVDVNYCRPSVGRGRDFGWRLLADHHALVVQISTADFGWQSVAFLQEVVTHRFARLSEALLGAEKRLPGLVVKLNDATLDVDAATVGLESSGVVMIVGEAFTAFEASYQLSLGEANVPDVMAWIRLAIESLTPIYLLLAPPLVMFAGEEPEDEEAAYPEGSASFRTHRHLERDPKVVLEAKRQFRLRNNDRLFCEVCDFDFLKAYGERGRGFAEGHHTKPVARMKQGDVTLVSDIAIVCSNCHRMLHRAPLVLPSELRIILKSQQNH